MKKVFIGLLLGIVLCGVAGYLMMPKMKQTEYDRGYDAGNKNGIVVGTNAGITQGIAEIKAQQQHQRDSIATVEQNRRAAMMKRVHKAPKVVKVIQNWHVIDGKIEDPIDN